MNIPGIGIYLGTRFKTHSIWDGNSRPIKNNTELLTFLQLRRNTPNTRQKIKDWLSYILENARSETCVGDGYFVPTVNKNGWNNVIDFLRTNLNNSIKKVIPRKKQNRTKSAAYPEKCK